MNIDELYKTIGSKSMVEQVDRERQKKKMTNYFEEEKEEEEEEMKGEGEGEAPIKPVFDFFIGKDPQRRKEMMEALEKIEDAPNSDALYDPLADEANEKWVSENFMKTKGKTDAVICCPFCFTTLSYYTQQHVKYKNQFRAVEVVNCVVKHTQTLKEKDGTETNPVECAICSVQVAILDYESVYHFYNVITERN